MGSVRTHSVDLDKEKSESSANDSTATAVAEKPESESQSQHNSSPEGSTPTQQSFQREDEESDPVADGCLIENISAFEVTLTKRPAVKHARFRIVKSQADKDSDPTISFESPFLRTDSKRRQVWGYVLVPWIEDSYGDVEDPINIMKASHSYLKNLAFNSAEGQGVGVEHIRFGGYGYPIESIFDKTGEIGGIPGAWWLGMQITDTDIWNQIESGEIVGYSIGGIADFIWVGSDDGKSNILSSLSKFTKASAIQPEKRDRPKVTIPEGYPTSKADYADANNMLFPINTLTRCFAFLNYIANDSIFEDYSNDEKKYMIKRTLSSAIRLGYKADEETKEQFELTKNTLMNNFLEAIGMKKVDSTAKEIEKSDTTLDESHKEDEVEMTKDEMQEVLKSQMETMEEQITKSVMDKVNEDIQKNVETTVKNSMEEVVKKSMEEVAKQQKEKEAEAAKKSADDEEATKAEEQKTEKNEKMEEALSTMAEVLKSMSERVENIEKASSRQGTKVSSDEEMERSKGNEGDEDPDHKEGWDKFLFPFRDNS